MRPPVDPGASPTFGASSRFPAEAGSVRSARRFAAERLAAAERSGEADTVLLLVSELVTNAVLHARTPFTLTLRSPPRGNAGVRIEVQDDSPLPPTPADLGVSGMSGRGMRLVEAFATSWGVETIPGDGKAVWCEVGGSAAEQDGYRPVPGDRPAASGSAAGRAADPVVEVVVPDLPVPALVAAKLQVEDVIRDLKVVLLTPDGHRGADPIAAAELAVARRLDAAAAEFGDGRRQMRAQALSAAGRGDATVTLRLRLPASAAAAARRYRDALNDADALNRAGGLLVGRSLAEHDRLRRWYLREIITQLDAAGAGRARS